VPSTAAAGVYPVQIYDQGNVLPNSMWAGFSLVVPQFYVTVSSTSASPTCMTPAQLTYNA
jgi:hypothetical protein